MHAPTEPVAIAFEHAMGAATTFEFSMNFDGDEPDVKVKDVATGQDQTATLQATYSKRLSFNETRDGENPWYLHTGTVASVTITVPATLPSGQYRLTLGEHLRWRLLDHSASRLVLEAPRGLPIVGFEDYFFSVQAAGDLPIYAYRPVEVYDATGAAVAMRLRPGAQQPDGSHRDGLYEVSVVPGIYRVRSVPITNPNNPPPFRPGPIGVDTPQDNFLRLENDAIARPVFAVGTAAAWFLPPNPFGFGTAYAPIAALPNCTAEPCSATSRPGREGSNGAYHFWERMTETPAVPFSRLARGSVSFWMRPNWEASRKAYGNQLNVKLFEVGPLSVSYAVVNDAEANGTTPFAYFNVHVPSGRAVNGNDGSPATAINVPVRHWPIGGRWYHVAVVWDLDGSGSDSRIQVFIDGRLMLQYARVNTGALPATAALTSPPQSAPMRIGSDHTAAEHLVFGTTLDEIRVYEGICYTGDFTPGPSTTCPTPMLYASFDDGANPLTASLDGQRIRLALIDVN
jgi:hypothetical protein